MHLKTDSPNELVQAIQAIEDRADLCFEKLPLYAISRGKASWGVLVSVVLRTEEERQKEGYRNYDVKLLNLSRWAALALRWVSQKGNPEECDPQRYSWTKSLAESVGMAISVAKNYDAFLSCFPMWHQNRLLAELTSNSAVRFAVPGGSSARRVSAYQKGFGAILKPVRDEGLVLTPDQERERAEVLSQCFYVGHQAIAYPEPLSLYQSLLPPYLDRIDKMFRRSESVDLGPYTVGDLKRGYAALTTVLSVHALFSVRFEARIPAELVLDGADTE